MTPSSHPPLSCPTPSSPLLLLTENGSGKLCEERRGGCCPSQRYPLKFVGHRHDCGNAKEKDSIRGERERERESPLSPSPLVKTAATPLIGCSSHRNCRCSPTRNHARRIYDLMSSAFSLSLFLVRFFYLFFFRALCSLSSLETPQIRSGMPFHLSYLRFGEKSRF